MGIKDLIGRWLGCDNCATLSQCKKDVKRILMPYFNTTPMSLLDYEYDPFPYVSYSDLTATKSYPLAYAELGAPYSNIIVAPIAALYSIVVGTSILTNVPGSLSPYLLYFQQKHDLLDVSCFDHGWNLLSECPPRPIDHLDMLINLSDFLSTLTPSCEDELQSVILAGNVSSVQFNLHELLIELKAQLESIP